MREVLLIAASAIFGGCLGVMVTCLVQVSKDCEFKRKEITDYEEEKYSEDCEI